MLTPSFVTFVSGGMKRYALLTSTAFLPTRQDPQPIRTMIVRALGTALFLSKQISPCAACLLTPLHWLEAFQLLFYEVVFLQVRS